MSDSELWVCEICYGEICIYRFTPFEYFVGFVRPEQLEAGMQRRQSVRIKLIKKPSGDID